MRTWTWDLIPLLLAALITVALILVATYAWGQECKELTDFQRK